MASLPCLRNFDLTLLCSNNPSTLHLPSTKALFYLLVVQKVQPLVSVKMMSADIKVDDNNSFVENLSLRTPQHREFEELRVLLWLIKEESVLSVFAYCSPYLN